MFQNIAHLLGQNENLPPLDGANFRLYIVNQDKAGLVHFSFSYYFYSVQEKIICWTFLIIIIWTSKKYSN